MRKGDMRKDDMRKKALTGIFVVGMTMMLAACSQGNSKVDQVIQQQIDAIDNPEENKPVIDEAGDVTALDNPGEIQGSSESGNVGLGDAETADGGADSSVPGLTEPISEDGIDVDLTAMSSTMVYSEVYNMMCYPESYIGKIVKMDGLFSFFQDESTGQMYFACIIQDATACCAQGIEFELAGEHKYPDDYPEIGETLTVIGEFETYREGDYLYCRLKNASMS